MSRTERRTHPEGWGRDGVARCSSGASCEICGKAEAKRANRRDRHAARTQARQWACPTCDLLRLDQ